MIHDALLTVGILLLVGLVVAGLILFGPDPLPADQPDDEHWLDDYRDTPTGEIPVVEGEIVDGVLLAPGCRPAPRFAGPYGPEVDPLTAPLHRLAVPAQREHDFYATAYALAWDLPAAERYELVAS